MKIIPTHEIGHIIFEKKLSKELKQLFTAILLQTFPDARFESLQEYKLFVNEQFAGSYEIFINLPEKLKKFPLINNFFNKYII